MLSKKDLPLIVGYLLYGLKVKNLDSGRVSEVVGINIQTMRIKRVCMLNGYRLSDIPIVQIKPLLKPMSMFDEEEGEKYHKWHLNKVVEKSLMAFDAMYESPWISSNYEEFEQVGAYTQFLQYCYANHYDINNLIGKGLAEDIRNVEGC